MTGGCWKADNRYESGYASCSGSLCCLATYEVCMTANGRTFTQTSAPAGQFECGFIVPAPECVVICNSLPKRYPLNHSKPSMGTASGGTIEAVAVPNPVTGLTTIMFSSTPDIHTTLIVTGSDGHSVIRQSGRTELDGSGSFIIDVAPLPSGVYHYRIENGEMLVAEGSIVVTR